MPQLNQLMDVALSQFFWLAIVLGAIYFGIGKFMLPKIQSTVDLRDRKIADDLAAAQAARAAADESESAYRERLDASRAEAAKLTAKAKDHSAREIEKKLAKADAAIQAKIEKAEAKIRDARAAAVKEIEALAAELAQDITGKVAGITVTKADAASAVKSEMAGA
jgi:F-type H+-transporting ATPase subunit b